jgi:hypothetical protein
MTWIVSLLVAVMLWLPVAAIADIMPLPLDAQRRISMMGPPLAARAMTGGLAAGPRDPGEVCRQAMAAAGRQMGVPDHLMAAIGRVESGRRGPNGKINPWPWSINVEGVDHIFETREAAIAAVRGYQAKGVRSIDVGCMQVNLLHHPDAFANLDQGFDPVSNARYAASFLNRLRVQTGSWEKATAFYHSATPELGEPYQKKVVSVLAEEAQHNLQSLGPGGVALGPRLGPASGGLRGPVLTNRSETARILPMAGATGRTLEAYRAMPIRVATRGPTLTP